jgi:hypothetical protein
MPNPGRIPMQKTFKTLFFGALIATVVMGAFTATARQAHAADVCEPCPENSAGYLIASGLGGTECVEATDPRYIEQCT